MTLHVPCNPCGGKSKDSRVVPTPKAFVDVRRATAFDNAMSQMIHDAGLQIASGQLDPVIALLVLRRRIGYVAEKFEACEICREDLKMSEDFDQYMINAKTARITFTEQQQHRQALGMYLRFQKSIIKGAWFWAVKPILKDFVHELVRIHMGEREE